MSKIKKYVLLFAGLVTAFTGFTSCKSDALEEIDSDSNEQETLGEAIKAQFTISIPRSTGKATRQGADIVQSDPDITKFRGINEIKLYPSALMSANLKGEAANSQIIGRNIALSTLLIPEAEITANSIPKATLTANSNSVLYGDVLLQIGTRSFLFYGAAIGKEQLAAYKLGDYDADAKIVNGHLTISNLDDEATDYSTFEFSPTPITTATAFASKRGAIINYLKSIAATTGWYNTTNEGLKKLYDDFTGKSSSSNFIMAGSSKSLEAAVEDLYFSLIGNSDALAQAICSKICSGTPDATTGVAEDTNVKVTNNSITKKLEFKSTLANYPAEENLPDGAAVIIWDNSTPSVPSYVLPENTAETQYGYVSSSMNVANFETFAYPACLYYWGKSDILTSEVSRQSLFNGTNSWADIASDDENKFEDGPAITSKTRSVVLVEPVNYAVGRLDFSVVYPTDITDANKKFPDRGGDSKKYPSIDNIKLTGILIGGQKPVDWKFEQSTGTEYTVYDNITKSITNAPTSTTKYPPTYPDGIEIKKGTDANKSAYISTLVLESAGKVGTAEDKVNVALEFVNNGDDFFGKQGIVPKGTKFYLVGSLDASKASEIASNSDNTSSYNNTGGKVFKQDFVTRAQFTVEDVKNAYNTIPDLRNPAVELGLSVNLSWQEGITFKHTFKADD